MIQAQYKDEAMLDFTDVSEMLKWSAGKLGCEVMELTAETGGDRRCPL